MGKFVDVYSKRTGKKSKVPEHYLGNPRLMAPFELTPKGKSAQDTAPPPPPPADPDSDAGPTAPGTHSTTETRAVPGDKE